MPVCFLKKDKKVLDGREARRKGRRRRKKGIYNQIGLSEKNIFNKKKKINKKPCYNHQFWIMCLGFCI